MSSRPIIAPLLEVFLEVYDDDDLRFRDIFSHFQDVVQNMLERRAINWVTEMRRSLDSTSYQLGAVCIIIVVPVLFLEFQMLRCMVNGSNRCLFITWARISLRSFHDRVFVVCMKITHFDNMRSGFLRLLQEDVRTPIDMIVGPCGGLLENYPSDYPSTIPDLMGASTVVAATGIPSGAGASCAVGGSGGMTYGGAAGSATNGSWRVSSSTLLFDCLLLLLLLCFVVFCYLCCYLLLFYKIQLWFRYC